MEFLKMIQSGLLSLWKILSEGIRAKLAWFTGTLIALTILLLSIITVRQQTAILSESYEKQAAVSKNFIAGLVMEIESISQNLIRIEEFKSRIEKQQEELKKYQTAKLVTKKKTVSVFGFKTNLFGSLGSSKVLKKFDTFFSVYLTKDDVTMLEREIRQQLREASNRNISERDWNTLVNLAAAYVKNEEKYLDIIKQPTPEENEAKSKWELDIKNIKKEIRNHKSKLDLFIAKFYADSKKRKLEELGLDTKLFRIQTFPISAMIQGETSIASFDTQIIDNTSPLAKIDHFDQMESSLVDSFQKLSDDITSVEENEKQYVYEWRDREIQALHSPLFRHQNSTKRAFNLIGIKSKLGDYREVIKEDYRITNELSQLIPKLRERIQYLKNAKPPIPPAKDKLFTSYYKSYNELVTGREKIYDEVSLRYPIPKELEEKIESLRSLRDVTLEDWVLLKFKTDPLEYEKYYQDPEAREEQRNRWKAIRKWIITAEQETPTKELKKLFPDGSFGHSRSESEEIMWKLDGTHLLEAENVPLMVLRDNFSGLIRTLVDRTDGIRAIKDNRNQIVFTAITICMVAILFAIFISGVVVQKIRKIIRSAEDVGQGNLHVHFDDGGNDEFGNLTVALNQMVSGLKEREKMRGVLGSMVDPVVVGEALKDLEKLKQGSEKVITAFFSDIAGFSTISEKLNSKELADLLNEYLSAMTLILKQHDGVLDKYIGDAIVGIFNAPLDVENHCLKAVSASVEMRDKLEGLKKEWIQNNAYIPEAHDMKFRIGLNMGYAKVGFMGTDALASYTMMGDTVNLAARLEAAGKDYGVCILVSEFVHDEIKDHFFTRKLDTVRVKGKSKPVTLYEVRCKKGEETEEDKKFVNAYETALFSYFNRKFPEAKRQFETLYQSSHDEACKLLLERCQYYIETPPELDWDGSFTRTKK
ncbi:HAMP domain-containing protein [Leptospira levettii]|nr:adenylate/guanylate cyclase domain-containing protein [Leptospira levettii]MCW7509491.1 HAMP domain-containing protein [Leptospira levettii]MCW7520685.1 HAMP domain-containing protein [Leptospira levettii]